MSRRELRVEECGWLAVSRFYRSGDTFSHTVSRLLFSQRCVSRGDQAVGEKHTDLQADAGRRKAKRRRLFRNDLKGGKARG